MKKYLQVFAMVAVSIGVAVSAFAVPYMPPLGPLYIKFDNVEQISPTNQIVSPSGNPEGNWGIFIVSTIAVGDTTDDPQNFDPINPPIWTSGVGGQITGIFGGITALPGGPPFNSTGGELWLYWDEPGLAGAGTMVNLAGSPPTARTGDFQYPGFTDGILLARITLVPGAIVPDPDVTVTGTVIPTNDSFTGVANSFGDVADVNGDNVIDGADGAWASLLNSNYFTNKSDHKADLKFRNIYEGPKNPWNGPKNNDNQTVIFGAQSSDPARAYAVPEPATLLLLGSGLAGLAGFSRRRRNQEKQLI
ncbi:MAG: PEP-CTERM sorting domain-containing protein [Desulfosoma sp.]|uniref:PEP-CTERM sorting domain-containing protein n=1 Tax=Desulfosoma sp. TaxID=2603217 RepID=UPI004049150C